MKKERKNTVVDLHNISQKMWGKGTPLLKRFLVGQTVRETMKRTGLGRNLEEDVSSVHVEFEVLAEHPGSVGSGSFVFAAQEEVRRWSRELRALSV